ncbi:MAG: fasciclin domain-containing protein [Ilumatobacteraceae bacterium]|nr:fasciclin domain-containing protein [Ilumatobacteraceae bacterium]
MRKTQKFIALAAVASLGVFATACGSDSDDAATDEAVTEETVAEEVMTEDTAAATEEEAGAEAPQTIVDIAAGNPDFSTLVSLVTAAGLAETLAGEGPFTVLAPTNAGFEALAEKMGVTIDELAATLTGDVELLKTVLTSHVIAGKVLAADTAALNGMEADLVSGEKAKVVSADGVVSFTIGTSTATVVTPDIEASNGVIHIVDMPLLPLSMQK